jgi:hypothetical protein
MQKQCRTALWPDTWQEPARSEPEPALRTDRLNLEDFQRFAQSAANFTAQLQRLWRVILSNNPDPRVARARFAEVVRDFTQRS